MDKILTDLRKEVDEATAMVVEALNKRAGVAQRIGVAKQGNKVYVPEREAQVIQQALALSEGPLSKMALTNIIREVIGACRNLEKQLRVAYLGPEGTYSGEAAQKFAGSTSRFVPSATIDDAFMAVAREEADIAVVPAENSSEGAVNRTLDLLLETSLRVIGEVTLPIRHQLLSKSSELIDIREVIAHPQALAQCRRWLESNLPKAQNISASSNAEAARLAAKDASKAAIASKLAAGIYGLNILQSGIEDSASNATRFLVLGSQSIEPTGNDKTSLVCSAPNRSGSLYELIGVFAKAGINMTKLESRPSAGALWDYIFYIDIDGHEADAHIAEALKRAREHATLVKVLGSYPKALV